MGWRGSSSRALESLKCVCGGEGVWWTIIITATNKIIIMDARSHQYTDPNHDMSPVAVLGL